MSEEVIINGWHAQQCICCPKWITVKSYHITRGGGSLFTCRQCFARYGWDYRLYATPRWAAAFKEGEERDKLHPPPQPTPPAEIRPGITKRIYRERRHSVH
jgi:hypothetical protein